jgi:glycosyltransferase involved in cell wall biosynthesis
MHAGVAIVATRVGGVPAILEDGRCGVLTEPGDVAGLAKAISEVLANEVSASAMVRNSQLAIRGYSSERMTDRYLEAYSSVMSAGPSASVGQAAAIGDRNTAGNVTP